MNNYTSSAINSLKFFCLMGVIMIHCNPVNLLGSEIEESTKITFDVINVFLGLCVPCLNIYLFIMSCISEWACDIFYNVFPNISHLL